MSSRNSAIGARLEHIVRKLTADPELRKDLMQQARLRLWLERLQRPGQTQSWYIQNCSFFLKDDLGKGESIDLHKRRKNQGLPPLEESGSDESGDSLWRPEQIFGVDDSQIERISAPDI